ncbi:Coiled-coil domain-containing protein 109B [Heterocephalus glaber]|uniref:Calcium uniporter protein n=1 Tax=Heterocephalus glaber TaxID=10181 RepID=G5AQL8_HETGA|nr:Coiled-coil domain-containing protein 109B [Heterocephalus glaber]
MDQESTDTDTGNVDFLVSDDKENSNILHVKLCGNPKYPQSHLSSAVVAPDEVTVNYRHGLPLITLTLPSRKERCRFVVKPMLSTVGSFLQDLHHEDKGVRAAAIFTAECPELVPVLLIVWVELFGSFGENDLTPADEQEPKQPDFGKRPAREPSVSALPGAGPGSVCSARGDRWPDPEAEPGDDVQGEAPSNRKAARKHEAVSSSTYFTGPGTMLLPARTEVKMTAQVSVFSPFGTPEAARSVQVQTAGKRPPELRQEARGPWDACAQNGSEIPASTLMDVLLMKNFKLVVNERAYVVQSPKGEKPSREPLREMENAYSLVHRLFSVLHPEESQKETEHRLLVRIDHLQAQLQPLEQVKARIEARAEANTSRLLWAGLALLSAQGGALAWLTWWVYSWDLMEPVTCFLTFANSMAFFAYFIVTRQNCTYPTARRRQLLHIFHKWSRHQRFDVQQYSELKDELAKAKESLKRVRRSVYLGLQVEELKEKN